MSVYLIYCPCAIKMTKHNNKQKQSFVFVLFHTSHLSADLSFVFTPQKFSAAFWSCAGKENYTTMESDKIMKEKLMIQDPEQRKLEYSLHKICIKRQNDHPLTALGLVKNITAQAAMTENPQAKGTVYRPFFHRSVEWKCRATHTPGDELCLLPHDSVMRHGAAPMPCVITQDPLPLSPAIPRPLSDAP